MHSVECPAAAAASFFVYLLAHGYGWRLWRRRRYPAPTFENEEIQSLSESLTLYSICWKRRKKIKLMARSHSVVEKSQGNNKIKNVRLNERANTWSERGFFLLWNPPSIYSLEFACIPFSPRFPSLSCSHFFFHFSISTPHFFRFHFFRMNNKYLGWQ